MFNKGGAELQVKYISEYLQENGFSVDYLFIHEKEITFMNCNIKMFGLKKMNILESLFGKICYYFKVLEKLKEIQPDIIYHRNLSNFALPVIQYNKTRKIKSFIHLAHKNDLEKLSLKGWNFVKNILDFYGRKNMIMKFDHIIAQAEYQDHLMNLNFNRRASLIFKNVHPIPQEKRRKNYSKKIIWIANYKTWKQPEIFINLAETCKMYDAEFIMIGRDENNTISNLIKQKNHVYNLKYLGEMPLNKVNEIISESYLFINTSLYEGFPNTFIQSWMREVPVVSLNVDPDSVLVKNNIGLHSKTIHKLTEDIKYLINNEPERNRLAKFAKEYAITNHSKDKLIEFVKFIKDDQALL